MKMCIAKEDFIRNLQSRVSNSQLSFEKYNLIADGGWRKTDGV